MSKVPLYGVWCADLPADMQDELDPASRMCKALNALNP